MIYCEYSLLFVNKVWRIFLCQRKNLQRKYELGVGGHRSSWIMWNNLSTFLIMDFVIFLDIQRIKTVVIIDHKYNATFPVVYYKCVFILREV